MVTLGAVVAFVAIKFNLECGPLKSAAGIDEGRKVISVQAALFHQGFSA